MSDRYAQFYWKTVFADPHFEAGLKKGDLINHARHPLSVLPKRYFTLVKAWQSGAKIALNKVGGWMALNDKCEILKEEEHKTWPDSEKISDTRLYVYIQKWPMANHYYLSSWPKPILFPQVKYNTYQEAFDEAKKHTHESCIKFKESEAFNYPAEGA